LIGTIGAFWRSVVVREVFLKEGLLCPLAIISACARANFFLSVTDDPGGRAVFAGSAEVETGWGSGTRHVLASTKASSASGVTKCFRAKSRLGSEDLLGQVLRGIGLRGGEARLVSRRKQRVRTLWTDHGLSTGYSQLPLLTPSSG
jgi:hypothetical protein